MDKQNLMPQAAQPVNRITTGQLPAQLAELSEEALQLHGDDSASVLASLEMADSSDSVVCRCACVPPCHPCGVCGRMCSCSYDGDDAE